jgi:hypothetical protein
VTVSPILLRRPSRRLVRRLVFLVALAGTFIFAPGAANAGAPVITPVIFGTLGLNGWYTSNVTVNWLFDGPVESSSGCEAVTISADTPGRTLTCSATRDGFTTTVSKTFKVDKTIPTISTAPERQPDSNGWYNRPFTVGWMGTDAISGVATCTASRYAGPDSTEGLVPGSCSDNAGNVAGSWFAFKYDATAPTVFAVTAKPGNRSVEISWRASPDTKIVHVLRAPGKNGQGETVIYQGSATGLRDIGLAVGRTYEYRVTGFDEAANWAQHTIKIVATGALLSPTPGARVSLSAPPRLIWTPVKGARYYNVQLMRGRRVLSAWPARPGFQLRRTWTYKGRRYKLQPGTYRWYVWPRISSRRYGRLLGSSTFVVTK